MWTCCNHDAAGERTIVAFVVIDIGGSGDMGGSGGGYGVIVAVVVVVMAVVVVGQTAGGEIGG